MKKERLSAKQQKDFNAKKGKHHDDPEKKRQTVTKRYDDKKEFIKYYKKGNYVENKTSNITCQNALCQENPEVQLMYEIICTIKIQRTKENIKK